MRVLAVGGGSGGLSCHFGGGGSGYVNSGEFSVMPLQSVSVTVGKGGEGSPYGDENLNPHWQDSKPGGPSSFGAYISAAGGEGAYGNGEPGKNRRGSAGGSGGGAGAGGNGGVNGAAGGADGSSGRSSPDSNSEGPGTGQGSFGSHLARFVRNRLTAGAGGSTSISSYPRYTGGGGGGGVLFNGKGPLAQSGTGSGVNGFGGTGFGAGGGAGGYLYVAPYPRYGGGRGADGLVYIEW